jgi:hypothetical protein
MYLPGTTEEAQQRLIGLSFLMIEIGRKKEKKN